MDRIVSYMEKVADLARSIDARTVRQIGEVLMTAMLEGRQVFLFGNGGSAATAAHFAVDLGKGLRGPGGARMKAHCLVDSVPTLTAWANDTDYSRVFAEQIVNFAHKGDVAVAISGSGNSPNVLEGVKAAARAGAFTIGLTGYRGGRLKDLVDLFLVIPSDNMQHIEDMHMVVAHAIYSELRDLLAVRDEAVLSDTESEAAGRAACAGSGD